MNNPLFIIAIGIAALALGSFIGYFVKQTQEENRRKAQNLKADHILTEAREKAREIELEAKDNALNITQKAEDELSHRRAELSKEDDRLQKRREELDRRLEKYEERESRLNKRQSR